MRENVAGPKNHPRANIGYGNTVIIPRRWQCKQRLQERSVRRDSLCGQRGAQDNVCGTPQSTTSRPPYIGDLVICTPNDTFGQLRAH